MTMPTAARKVSAPIRSIRAVPKPSLRGNTDACPGALRLHDAADGPLARVRVPGGRMTGAQLAAIRRLAEEHGDGHAELTSRANLQLRALKNAPVGELQARLEAAGLLPSPTHELVRNIAASPLAGGPLDISSLVTTLDRALCADPALAALPGRFLFAVDSGQGDVAFGADAAALPLGAEVAILFGGTDAGLRVRPGGVVAALLAAAHAFLDERAATQPAGATAGVEGRRIAWRVRELVDGPARVAARTAAALGVPLGEPGEPPRPSVREPVGIIDQPDGLVAVGALVPLGRLSGAQLQVLESAVSLVVTPWRGVVLPDLAPAEADSWAAALAGVGLEVAAGSRWVGVTTCAGQPGCAKSLADVRHDAFVTTTVGAGLPVHWVGCARGCGSPAGPHVRVEATGSGYEVRSPHLCGFAPPDAPAPGPGLADACDLGALVGAARRV